MWQVKIGEKFVTGTFYNYGGWKRPDYDSWAVRYFKRGSVWYDLTKPGTAFDHTAKLITISPS